MLELCGILHKYSVIIIKISTFLKNIKNVTNLWSMQVISVLHLLLAEHYTYNRIQFSF
jgi:hypothetical protein